MIGEAEDIRANLLETRKRRRGYVMTGDEQFPGLERRLCGPRLAESRKLLRDAYRRQSLVNSAGSMFWTR